MIRRVKLLADRFEKLIRGIAGLFDNAKQGSAFEFASVHWNHRSTAIRMTEYGMTAGLAVDVEAESQEGSKKVAGLK